MARCDLERHSYRSRPGKYVMLGVLMASSGQLMTGAQLERQLYGLTRKVNSNRVEVHIHNLPRELGERFIRNLRGRGYGIGGS